MCEVKNDEGNGVGDTTKNIFMLCESAESEVYSLTVRDAVSTFRNGILHLSPIHSLSPFSTLSDLSKMVAQPFQKISNPPDSVVFRTRPKWSPRPFKKSVTHPI